MRLLFPILKYFGLRRIDWKTCVLGAPETTFYKTYYVWVWGKKWKKLNQMCRPVVIKGTIKAVSRTKIEAK